MSKSECAACASGLNERAFHTCGRSTGRSSAEVAVPDAPVGLLGFRSQHPGMEPWALAYNTAEGNVLVELTSFPWEEAGLVWIMGRATIGDPTSNRQYSVTDLKPDHRSREIQRAYVEGFTHGWACCAAETRKMLAEFHQEKEGRRRG